MRGWRYYIGDLFISNLWYLLMLTAALLFLLAYFLPLLLVPAALLTGFILLATLLDYVLLFFTRGQLLGERRLPARLSLGDDHNIVLQLHNQYAFTLHVQLIDELPEQFQERNFLLQARIGFRKRAQLHYSLRPLTRGQYHFGRLLAYVRSPLRLLQRRIVLCDAAMVKVYPSFHQLKKYQLMALSDSRLSGDKKIRRIGHSLEFEKIKDYVTGDDIRNINWKATARSSGMMVNTYTDARQQQIYCLIDKGRTMKMPFDGLSLLDHAINASLALLHIVLLRQDKAGLLSFCGKDTELIPADRRNNQFYHLREALYQQETDFRESDYNQLANIVQRKIAQRSLLLLFTNFETMSSLERQLPYLRRMASRHLLCIVFFENTLLRELQEQHPDTVKGIYIKTIAERFSFEKKQIVMELRRHGILSILSTPQRLTVDVLNKYLELKSRQMV